MQYKKLALLGVLFVVSNAIANEHNIPTKLLDAARQSAEREGTIKYNDRIGIKCAGENGNKYRQCTIYKIISSTETTVIKTVTCQQNLSGLETASYLEKFNNDINYSCF